MVSQFRIAAIFGIALCVFFSGCQFQAEADPQGSAPRAAVLITEGFQDAETLDPIDYLTARGVEVTVIGPEVMTVQAYNSDVRVQIEAAVADVSVADFDALIIPGGYSPGRLREDRQIVGFVRDFVDSGKPVAAICHGPQVLIRAGVMENRTATCFGGMREELIEANANYVDAAVAIDGNVITSRVPDDIPQFNQAIGRAMGL